MKSWSVIFMKAIRIRTVFLVLLLVITSQTLLISNVFAGAQTLNPWIGFRHDESRSGYTLAASPSQGIEFWNITLDGAVWSSPAVVEGVVFAGSDDTRIYAVNASTGSVLWNYSTGGPVRSSPWVYDGRVYVGSDDNYLYCLNETNGTLIWKWLPPLGGHYSESERQPLRSSPLVTGGRVYITYMTYAWFTGNHWVYYAILNSTSGSQIGVGYGGEGMLQTYASPAIWGSYIYVPLGKKLWCQDSTTISTYWTYPASGTLSDTIESSPAVGYGKAFFGCNDGRLYAIDRILGSQVWNFTTGDAVFASPSLYNERVYFGSLDGYFYCLNQSNGQQLWNRSLTYPIYSSAAIAEDKVFFGCTDGTFYTLNANNGQTLWTYVAQAGIKSSPAVADGIVYFGCEDKAVHVIPEFPSGIILSLLIFLSAIAVVFAKKNGRTKA